MALEERFVLTTSRHFPDWLASTGSSIVFTSYGGGKLFLIGSRGGGDISLFERSFGRCMGVAASADARSLLVATHFQIQRFDNVVPVGAGRAEGGYDAVYAPHAAWVTADLDAHDIAFGEDGRPIFVNTLFSCIATVSDGYSFKPLWRPPFVSRLAAEDRCHLNGMAAEGGKPRFVTAVSRSDSAAGWRDRRQDGGVVLDVTSGEAVATGLSMPHSPRLHEGRLWLLNSGRGELGYLDLASGRFEAVAFCPGYARGLAFVGGRAVVALSLARDDRAFTGLALQDELARRDADAWCGLAVFDLASGDLVDWVRIEGKVVRELYDVTVLPGVQTPSAIGFITDEVTRTISIEPSEG